MLTYKSWLLVAASLALASPGLKAGKMKITVMPDAAASAHADGTSGSAEEAIDAGMTRSMRTVTTVPAAPPVIPAAYPVLFSKILQNQTVNGSEIYLLAQAAPNPFGFAVTRVMQTINNAGAVALSPQPFVAENPSSVNGVTTAGAAPLFVNPLYNAGPVHAVATNGYVVAASPAGDTLLAMPTNVIGAQPLLSTAFNPVLAPGALRVAPGQGFEPLKNAAGGNTGAIAGMVAGKDGVFAAVAEGAHFFQLGANNRGIAKVTIAGAQLAQVGINSAFAGPRASQVSLVSEHAHAGGHPENVGVVFDNNAFIPGVAPAGVGAGAIMPNAAFGAGNGVVMHYDAELDRVFVGLRRLQKSAAVDEGGLIGVLVGVPVAAAGAPPGAPLDCLNFRSILHNPSAEVFGALANANECNRHDSIVGIYHGPGLAAHLRNNQVARDQNVYVSVHHLKTMRTSTGRSYLIVASDIGPTAGPAGATRSSGLYFVPIMGKKTFTALGGVGAETALPDQLGKVADATFEHILAGDAAVPRPGAVPELAVAASFAALPRASRNCITNTLEMLNDGRSRVRRIQVAAIDIQDLQVVGDTVFIAVNGNEALGQLNGAYQTTAIFDGAGNIKSWTPLQRVSSVAEAVASLAVDRVNGAVMYLDHNTHTTFHVSDWATNTDAANELKGLIAKHFPDAQGGVRAVQSFDAANPTFMNAFAPIGRPFGVGWRQQEKACALLVVLGYDKVMVVQTAFNNHTAQHFRDVAVPIAGRATFGAGMLDIQNVFVFDSTTNPDLKKIAPLTCAEVLKVMPKAAVGAPALEGYLYVGGFGGVCRLQATAGVADSGAVLGLPIIAAGDGWVTRNSNVNARVGKLVNEIVGLDSIERYAASAANYRFVRANNNALKDVRKILSIAGDPAAAAASTRLVCLMGDGYVVAAGDHLDLAGQAKVVLPFDATYAFDAVLVKNIAAHSITPIAAEPEAGGTVVATDANQSYLIIATEQGLVVQGLAVAANNRLVRLDNGDMPIQLAFEPRGRGGAIGGGVAARNGAGMLYVMAGSQADGNVRVHRFGVVYEGAAANVLTPRAGESPIIDLPMFRRYFATDGTQFLFGHDKALDTYEMLNQSMVASGQVAPLPLTWALGDAKLGSFSGAPVRESVSGAWIVPGSFGIRVND